MPRKVKPTNEEIGEGIKDSFAALQRSATNINAVSDSLSTLIAGVDGHLKALSLGISCWITCSKSSKAGKEWETMLGYTKVKGHWGMAIKRVNGVDETRTEDLWLFNNAPRFHRVESLTKLPELLRTISQRADEMSALTMKRIEEVSVILEALKEASTK